MRKLLLALLFVVVVMASVSPAGAVICGAYRSAGTGTLTPNPGFVVVGYPFVMIIPAGVAR